MYARGSLGSAEHLDISIRNSSLEVKLVKRSHRMIPGRMMASHLHCVCEHGIPSWLRILPVSSQPTVESFEACPFAHDILSLVIVALHAIAPRFDHSSIQRDSCYSCRCCSLPPVRHSRGRLSFLGLPIALAWIIPSSFLSSRCRPPDVSCAALSNGAGRRSNEVAVPRRRCRCPPDSPRRASCAWSPGRV